MSAWVVDKVHIDFLVSAGLALPGRGSKLRWFARQATEDDRTHEEGSWWGPGLATFVREAGRELTYETAGQVGAMLWNENRRSVNFRYAEDEIEPPYEFRQVAPVTGDFSTLANLVMVQKALDCYEYQTCESRDWRETEAHDFCVALQGAICWRLPGISEAKGWPIEEADVRAVRGFRIAG